MTEKLITVLAVEHISELFGSFDQNIAVLRQSFGADIVCRGGEIKISGGEENVAKAARAIEGLLRIIERGENLNDQTLRYMVALVEEGKEDEIGRLSKDIVCITAKGRPIKAKTLGQKKYIDAMRQNTITLAIGPAGTGKTFLGVALAARALRAGEITRIILTRPAVEAGEKLGFLPGDLQNKVDPYLRPLYDALFEMMGVEGFHKYLERAVIEIAPLAYMRGRTLDDSYIILDEAQNTTPEQMKMFLTRMGQNSRMIITGDVTQIDLPEPRKSGLIEAAKVLKNIDDIAIVRFTERDVVRHKLVQEIIKAYDRLSAPRR
jgi:phosphate starvation-inducible PhoH-like protein